MLEALWGTRRSFAHALALIAVAVTSLAVAPAPTQAQQEQAQQQQAQREPAELERGPVTNLPLPRYVSMKASKGNVRRGPSLTHRIDWIYTRRDMPLEITAEYGHWRRVRDRDGAGGWVHYSLLSGARTVIVEETILDLHNRPDLAAPVEARLTVGVIARLGECQPDWCKISSGGYGGWARRASLWGIVAGEIVE